MFRLMNDLILFLDLLLGLDATYLSDEMRAPMQLVVE